MAQNHTQIHRSTDGHDDSMIEAAQWGGFSENGHSFPMVWDVSTFLLIHIQTVMFLQQQQKSR